MLYHPNSYQKDVLRTLPIYGGLKDVRHCVMGMAGEAAEVLSLPRGSDVALEVKEAGDCFWYVAALCHVKGWRLYDLEIEARTLQTEGVMGFHRTPAIRMVLAAGELVEMVKKMEFYGMVVTDPDFKPSVVRYIEGLLSVADLIGVPPHSICWRNIEKLKLRYPDKFDAQKAINKDEDVEAEVFGGLND